MILMLETRRRSKIREQRADPNPNPELLSSRFTVQTFVEFQGQTL